MNLLREKLRARGHHCPQWGGSSSASRSDTTTNNTDNRMAVQDGAGLTNSSGNSVQVNSTDAVKAISNMGADALKTIGGSIVELNKDSVAANVTAWDTTVKTSADLVDKLIDNVSKGYDVANTAISSFQPSENKASDTSLKLGMIAAAAVAATILLGKMGKST